MKIQSLAHKVDLAAVRAGSLVIPADIGGGYEIVQPRDVLFSSACMLAVAFIDERGYCISIIDTEDDEDDDADLSPDYQTS